jgi:hypothetical protein
MDIQSVKDEVRQYVALKDQIDLISTRQSEIKKRLIEAVDELGEFNDRGHKVLALDDDSINVTTLTKQRKVSNPLDMDVAEDLLTKRGIKDTCIKMVPTLDESAIMAAFYSGHLSEADIDAMFPEKVSYAFIVK